MTDDTPGDRRYKRVLEIEHEVEAQLLSAYLTEQRVPHIIQSYHDSAYGSLFQSQMVAWGYLEAPEEYEPLVLQVYADIRAGARFEAERPPGEPDEPGDPEPDGGPA